MKPWVSVEDALDLDETYYITSGGVQTLQLRGKSEMRTTRDPAYTILTKHPSGLIKLGFVPSEEASARTSQHRNLTPQEQAILQSFPADYDWPSSSTSARRQIGNSVPPLVAQRIADQIKDALSD